ncbi:unnamed protein product [Arctia plantaginis]|uniref:MD-2-related lipid-recognition domain-containing protein n=1 Tax=Arctia plantaginis TaxID=874455 RepID=A0A8S1A882_ARCPL|nr:unnamed protein product [Arctia plantaginis]
MTSFSDFNAQNLKTGLFWNIGANEWPLKLLKSDDACTFTTCPMEAGKIQKFTYNTTSSYLIRVLPRSTYRIRWKIWNKENNTQVCCFQTNLLKKDIG